jgi:hypothetical protein
MQMLFTKYLLREDDNIQRFGKVNFYGAHYQLLTSAFFHQQTT